MSAAARVVSQSLLLMALIACAGCGDDASDDEAAIERFIEDLEGEVDEAYVERTLGHVDMSSTPIDVRVPHHAGVYDETRAQELIASYRRVMRQRFYNSEITTRGERYELSGERAEIKLGLITAVGLLRAEMRLSKVAPGQWKLSKIHLRR